VGGTTNAHGPKAAKIAICTLGSKQMTITMDNQVTVSAHNGKGIASFIIGVTCTILLLALMGTAGVMTKAGTLTPEVNIIIGLGMMSVCFVDLIGIALGLFGVTTGVNLV
jgi:hypothetical protein